MKKSTPNQRKARNRNFRLMQIMGMLGSIEEIKQNTTNVSIRKELDYVATRLTYVKLLISESSTVDWIDNGK